MRKHDRVKRYIKEGQKRRYITPSIIEKVRVWADEIFYRGDYHAGENSAERCDEAGVILIPRKLM